MISNAFRKAWVSTCVSVVVTTNREMTPLDGGTDLLMPHILLGHSIEHFGSHSVLTLLFLLPSGYESPLQKEALEAVWISTWVSYI